MIDLTKLPDDHFERRRLLLLDGLEDQASSLCNYLAAHYPQRDLLQACSEFVYLDLTDGCKGDADSLVVRLGFFPWVEVEMELGECLNCLILERLKGTMDSLRRALELAVVAAYFSQANVPSKEAREWLASRGNTPFFSKAIKHLAEAPGFCAAQSSWQWADAVKKLYWNLCDYSHCKGLEFSLRALSNGVADVCGVSLLWPKSETRGRIFDLYIEVVQQIATILVLYNPVLMIGLPVDEKFGLWGPASGIFNAAQTARLKRVLPATYRDALAQIAQNDNQAQSICEWVKNMPDLSSEELRTQAAEHAELLKGLATPPRQMPPSGGTDV